MQKNRKLKPSWAQAGDWLQKLDRQSNGQESWRWTVGHRISAQLQLTPNCLELTCNRGLRLAPRNFRTRQTQLPPPLTARPATAAAKARNARKYALERRIGREWDWLILMDWLTDLGSHVPSEEWSRAYTLWGVCGCPNSAGRR